MVNWAIFREDLSADVSALSKLGLAMLAVGGAALLLPVGRLQDRNIDLVGIWIPRVSRPIGSSQACSCLCQCRGVVTFCCHCRHVQAPSHRLLLALELEPIHTATRLSIDKLNLLIFAKWAALLSCCIPPGGRLGGEDYQSCCAGRHGRHVPGALPRPSSLHAISQCGCMPSFCLTAPYFTFIIASKIFKGCMLCLLMCTSGVYLRATGCRASGKLASICAQCTLALVTSMSCAQ